LAGQGLKLFRSADTRPQRDPEHNVVVVAGREVAYRLKRSARRSFALHVDARGVSVAVPIRARLDEVERFILGHDRWLIEKLELQTIQAQRQRFAAIDGALFPVLGQSCRLRLTGQGRGAHWMLAADGVEELRLGCIVDPAKALTQALRARALPWFSGRVAEYCHLLGRPAPQLRLSSARTRWGSCSSRSGIRLHWRLLHLAPTLGDYVVAHEVAHLIEMNHSPRFWSVVQQLYPDWRSARIALRAAALDMPQIEAAPAMTED